MIQIGDILPEFKLKGVDNNWHTNFDFSDRYVLLIYFTNNTCPMAQAYRNRMMKLEQRYEEDNIGIVRVNPSGKGVAGESFEDMKNIAEAIGMEHLYLIDDDQQLARLCGAQYIPEVFVFNSKRELVYKGAIDDVWESEQIVTMAYLEDAIEASLDGVDADYPEIEAQGCKIIYQ